ncbi:hypothetical protein Ahy_B07g086923 [Arachis hypogaea]|uniref:Replication factor A C-terminal domain-containing protein n=1 Tax=Arachis hypogaea TaxID=3818 RepID=A0A444YAV5_ARAHY|nr:hypothetical protein Ahy_B07g086923 [Arachis hypogaea]
MSSPFQQTPINSIKPSPELLPSRFADKAFPSRHGSVLVAFQNGHSYRMGLRILMCPMTSRIDESRKPMIELIVMDQLCSIRNPHRRLFENDIIEERLYSISNFSLAINDKNISPLLILFRDTQLRHVEDINFPTNMFHFVSNELILSQQNPQSHLIDYIFFYMLWVLLLPKGTYLQSAMGVSNTNYNSLLYINLDFKEVKDFRQRNALTQITSHTAYSIEDDLLNRTPYKPICEIKELTDNGWWYKGCKLCYRALKEDESSYYCMFYDSFPNTHVPRICDDTDNAVFVIYDKEASRYLGTSASDIRASQLSKGSSKDDILDEINSFRGKKFLFKISVKLDDINAFQPCKITILKLCEDLQLITLFASKYKIYDENMPLENSEIQRAQSEFDVGNITKVEKVCTMLQHINVEKHSLTELDKESK